MTTAFSNFIIHFSTECSTLESFHTIPWLCLKIKNTYANQYQPKNLA